MSFANDKAEQGEWGTMRRSAAFITVALTALGGAASALAGGAILKGYGGQGPQVLGKVIGKNAGTHSGTLPFTGLNLMLFAVGAAVLVMAGVALLRASRSEP